MSHVYPYQWESNCRGVLKGYPIWTGGECHRGKWTQALFFERCQSPDQHLHGFIEKKNKKTKVLERFLCDLEKWFRWVFDLFNQPLDDRIRTWTLRFPAKENPSIEKALIDWPNVLQYDVKAKYQLISSKFYRTWSFFTRAFAWPTKSHARLYPFDKPIKSLYFRSFFLFCSFQGYTKIA